MIITTSVSAFFRIGLLQPWALTLELFPTKLRHIVVSTQSPPAFPTFVLARRYLYAMVFALPSLVSSRYFYLLRTNAHYLTSWRRSAAMTVELP